MAKLLIYAIGGFDENVFWLLIPHRFASNSTYGLKTWANRSEFVVIGLMKTLKSSKVGNAARNDKRGSSGAHGVVVVSSLGESRMVDMIIALWLAENGCLVGLNTKIVAAFYKCPPRNQVIKAQTCIANSNFITFSGRNQKTTKSLLPLLCCSQYRDHHFWWPTIRKRRRGTRQVAQGGRLIR